MTEKATPDDGIGSAPLRSRITDLAEEAILQAQEEIKNAMASSKASIDAAIQQYGSVGGIEAQIAGMQDVIQMPVEQAVQAQQTAIQATQDQIQAAQDQALKSITAAMASYPSPGSEPPSSGPQTN